MTTFLTVPFAEKDQAKNLGARWNADKKKWYVPPGVDLAPFKKWGAVSEADAVTSSAIATGAKSDRASKQTSMEEIGLTLTGDRYVERSHDCAPWLPCDLCDAPGPAAGQ